MPVKSRGVDVSDADAAVGDVKAGKTFYSGAAPKKTGTMPGLADHANAENTDVGAGTSSTVAIKYDSLNDQAASISQAITTTKRCAIVVVAHYFEIVNTTGRFQIQRATVNKTTEETVSAVNFVVATMYAHVFRAVEVLDAGTYTYDLVNESGGAIGVCGSTLVIEAVSLD